MITCSIPNLHSIFFKDFDPIFKIFTSCFNRYWSHIQYQICIPCFLKILIPYSRFSKFIKRIFRISGPMFYKIKKRFQRFWDSGNIRKDSWFFVNCLESIGGPKVNNSCFLDSRTRPNIRKPWKWRALGFPNPKSSLSKIKQNSSTEFWGHSFLKTYNKMTPPPRPPQTPNPHLFPDVFDSL